MVEHAGQSLGVVGAFVAKAPHTDAPRVAPPRLVTLSVSHRRLAAERGGHPVQIEIVVVDGEADGGPVAGSLSTTMLRCGAFAVVEAGFVTVELAMESSFPS